MTTKHDFAIAEAAHQALLLISPRRAMEALIPVLEDLAGQQQLINNLAEQRKVAEVERDAAIKRRDEAQLAAETAEARARSLFDGAEAKQRQTLAALTAEVAALEARRDAARGDAEAAESRLQRARDALRAATSAVG